MSYYTILVVIYASYNCSCFEHNRYEPNFIFRLPWYDTHWWTTSWYCDPWGISCILIQDTFAPQCEVKIVVFIVFLINANFAFLLIILFIIMLSLCLFLLCLCLLLLLICLVLKCLDYSYFCYYFVWYYNA